MFSRFAVMYFPRRTGDVRFATAVNDRMLAWPSKPFVHERIIRVQ